MVVRYGLTGVVVAALLAPVAGAPPAVAAASHTPAPAATGTGPANGTVLIDPGTGRPVALPEEPATSPSGEPPAGVEVLSGGLYQINHHAQCASAGCVNAARQCNYSHGWCSVLWWSWLTGSARHAYSVRFKYAIYVNGHKVKGWQDYGHSEPGGYLWHGSWGAPTKHHGRGYYTIDSVFVRHFGPNDKLEFRQDGDVIIPGGKKYLLKSYGKWGRWD